MRALIKPLMALIIANVLYAADVTWKPIDPQHLALKTPKVDPEADAEAIFWDTWVEDFAQGGYAQHKEENYIRIKLYNARAVEKWGDVKVEYSASMNATISDFKGRVIKTDGSIVEVKGGQVKDITVFKTGRLNVRAKSFAFPALQPGDIIEYKYNENISGVYLRYLHLPMQMDIPVWELTHHVKPLIHPGLSARMNSYPFNFAPKAWEPVPAAGLRSGFLQMQIQNVPAYVREPQMPSDQDAKAWQLIYYSENSQFKPDKYWPSMGKKLNDEYRKEVKVNGEIKSLAAELTGKLSSPTEKAKALVEYCQTKIRNVSYQTEGFKAQDREEFYKSLKDSHSTADTLKNKIGRSRDIRMLFFALAESAGLNPVFAAASSTSGPLFRADLLDPYFLRSNILIAIRDGDQLRFYDPGVPYLPPGMVDADVQGQPALLCDPKDPKLVNIPPSMPEASSTRRSANLKLSADGALQGMVRQVFTGHFNVEEKRYYDDKSPADRESEWKKQLEAQYPGAQITDLKVENADQPTGYFTVTYTIQIENYAQRLGKRLILQPGFFQYSKKPIFTASTRKHPVQYGHAFTDVDAVTIEIPEGFVIDAADMPGTTKLGEIGEYTFSATYAKETRTLRAKRNLMWGKGGGLWFEPKAYPSLKQLWDRLHSTDNHQITFKEE